MNYGFEKPCAREPELAVLATEIRVRVLNCSAAGCLVETDRPVPAGTISMLRIEFGGEEFEDAVRVVWCRAVGADRGFHLVGTQFLAATPPYAGTLRCLMHRESAALTGWLRSS